MKAATVAVNTINKVCPNSRKSFGIPKYCFRLGTEQIPPSSIRCNNHGYLEAFEALKMCENGGGKPLCSIGILKNTNYVMSAPAGDITGHYQ